MINHTVHRVTRSMKIESWDDGPVFCIVDARYRQYLVSGIDISFVESCPYHAEHDVLAEQQFQEEIEEIHVDGGITM